MKDYHKTKSYIKHATVAVANLEVSEDFYNNVIQLDTLSKNENEIVLGSNDESVITLVKSNGKKQIQEGLYHIAFLLKDETQLANWLTLNQKYSRFIGASHHGVSKAIYLEDPDGNGIEVYTDVDDSKWNRNGNQIEMVTNPLNVKELLLKADNQNHFDVIIGHLHLQTKNVRNVIGFYKALGFNITFDLQSAIFMSFNGYHHHIAFNQWNRFNMNTHQQDTTDVQAYEIWFESKDIFNNVKERLEKQNITYQQNGDFITVNDPLNIKIKLTY